MIHFLKALDLFKGLSSDDLYDVQSLSTLKKYKPGKFIFHENDIYNGVYIIVSGHVKVYQKGYSGNYIILALLNSGDIVGEMSAFGENIRSASVKVIKETECLFFSKKCFNTILRRFPTVGFAINKILSQRLRMNNNQIKLLMDTTR